MPKKKKKDELQFVCEQKIVTESRYYTFRLGDLGAPITVELEVLNGSGLPTARVKEVGVLVGGVVFPPLYGLVDARIVKVAVKAAIARYHESREESND